MRVGTIATVVQLYRLPDGTIKALIEGQQRVRINRFTSTSPHFQVSYTPLESSDKNCAMERTEALSRAVIREFIRYVDTNPSMPEEIGHIVGAVTEPGELADEIGRASCRERV